jgi:hypothetical protein
MVATSERRVIVPFAPNMSSPLLPAAPLPAGAAFL